MLCRDMPAQHSFTRPHYEFSIFLFSSLLLLSPGVSPLVSVLYRSTEKKEETRETAKWDIRNILDFTARPRIGRQVSCFFLFSPFFFSSRFFFSPATLTRILRFSHGTGKKEVEERIVAERGTSMAKGISSFVAKLSHQKSLEIVL